MRHLSQFNKGEVSDIAPVLQPDGTYRQGYNITLSDYQEGEGFTGVVSVIRGVKVVLVIEDGYKCLGGIEVGNKVVVFAVHPTSGHGRILLCSPPDDPSSGVWPFVYLFDDQNDPYGSTLGFDPDKSVRGFYLEESEAQRRMYFFQVGGPLKVLNLALAFDATGNVYQGGMYPRYLSVHSMDAQMDFTQPVITFFRRISNEVPSSDPTFYGERCNLLTGTYAVCARMVSKDGYASPWSQETNPFFVTDIPFDELTKSNHHYRIMEESGVRSQEGMEFRIEGIDTRWDKIQVAYIYHSAPKINEIKIFFEKTLTVNDGMLMVPLTKNEGIEASLAEVSAFTTYLRSVGDIAVKDDMLVAFNVKTSLPVESKDKSRIQLNCITKRLTGDETFNPTFKQVERPGQPTARKDNDPLTNTKPTTLELPISRYITSSGQTAFQILPIVNDFPNYKSQQLAANLGGFFGGESYPIGILWWDRKGNPMYVDEIGVFNVPNNYEGDGLVYNLTRFDAATGTYKLQIKGLQIDNYLINRSQLTDDKGNLVVSGFSVVVGPRAGRIKCQGIVTPLVKAPDDAGKKDFVYPLSGPLNNFTPNPSNKFSGSYEVPISDAVNFPKYHQFINGVSTYTVPNYLMFHSPDLLIEGVTGDNNDLPPSSDRLQIVNHVSNVYQNQAGQTNKGVIIFDNEPAAMYNKLYATNRNQPFQNRPMIGDKSSIKYFNMIDTEFPVGTIEKFDPDLPDDANIKFNVETLLRVNTTFANINADKISIVQPGSVIAKIPEWESVDSGIDKNNPASYLVANYVRQAEVDTANLGSQVTYRTVGHYQPIGEDVLSNLPYTIVEGNQLQYQFKGIEVWGGDCYVNFFDAARLYPKWSYKCEKNDLGVGFIAPVESKYNIALRYGRSLARNGFYMERSSCENVNPQQRGGISPKQREGWNYNAALIRESVRAYFARPKDATVVDDKTSSVIYSDIKTYGQLFDAFRVFPPLNYGDLNGAYGIGIALEPLFGELYFFQEKAYGQLILSPRSALLSTEGQIYTGKGDQYAGARYINVERGAQDRESVFRMANAIHFVDIRNGLVSKFSQAGHDDTSKRAGSGRKIQHWSKDQLSTKAVVGFDPLNGLLHVSLSDGLIKGADPTQGEEEIVTHCELYSEELDLFFGDSSFQSNHYFRVGRYLLSADPYYPEQVNMLGVGAWGKGFITKASTFTFVVNPAPNTHLVFDNIHIKVPQDQWGQITQITAQTDSDVCILNPASDDRIKYKNERLSMPLVDKTSRKRLKGNYLVVTITLDNSQQKPCRITLIETDLRPVQKL